MPKQQSKDFFDTRDSQSRAKHSLLRRYGGAWAGIIGTGLINSRAFRSARERGQPFELHLVYIDAFAGAGRYARDADQAPGEQREPVWGSPIIGLRAIEAQAAVLRERGLPVRVSGILVEADPEYYERLLENLGASALDITVEPGTNIPSAHHGQVNVFNADFRDVIGDLVPWLGDAFSLAFIDPWGPVMDLGSLAKLLKRLRTDAITLFPFHDLAVRGGSGLKDPSQLTPSDRGNITRTTAHFGTDEWLDIYRREELSAEAREEAFVQLYLRQLRSLDPTLWVKNIPLRFSKYDRTAYHLCLTTRDADGAMKMTQLLRDAEVEEEWEVWRDQEERERSKEEGQGALSLFGDLDVPFTPEPTKSAFQADIAEVERELLAKCADGRTHPLKDIYGMMADTPYVAGEINRALRALKKAGAAHFDDLNSARSQVRVGT